jgi:hypothetical protein
VLACAVQVAGGLLVLVLHFLECFFISAGVGVQLLTEFAVLIFQALGGVWEIDKVFHNL